MKTAAVVMAGLGAFLVPWTVVYWLAAHEHGGAVALLATVLALLFLGAYLFLQARRTGGRPEDDPEATPAEGAGDVGLFPGSSPWPAVMGAGAAFTAFFLVFSRWLAVPGLVLVLLAAAGLAAESQRARG
ncbi:MAG: aa3-type cytochrome oxidase subunit IV [Acidimicrobiia bacterium]